VDQIISVLLKTIQLAFLHSCNKLKRESKDYTVPSPPLLLGFPDTGIPDLANDSLNYELMHLYDTLEMQLS
jgi:hypothetical protein